MLNDSDGYQDNENRSCGYKSVSPEFSTLPIRLLLKAPFFLVLLDGATQASARLRRGRFTDSGRSERSHLHPDVGPLFELRFAGCAFPKMLRQRSLIMGRQPL